MFDQSLPSTSWRKFLYLMFPFSLLGLALTSEILALILDPIPFRRHDLDRLALEVQRHPSTSNYSPNIILVGDSVTQDILKTYTIGTSMNVANLTTNKASGLAGSYLLLRRYLNYHTPPNHLIVASTPEFFTYVPDRETARIYLKTVFRKIHEVKFLDKYLPTYNDELSPAILQIDERLGMKLLSLLTPAPTEIKMGSEIPNPHQIINLVQPADLILKDIQKRGQKSLNIPEKNVAIMNALCELAASHGFAIHFQLAPIPETTYTSWQLTGELDRFKAQFRNRLMGECADVALFSNYRDIVVPDAAMRDADHLIRHDWTNHYAVILNNLAHSLP